VLLGRHLQRQEIRTTEKAKAEALKSRAYDGCCRNNTNDPTGRPIRKRDINGKGPVRGRKAEAEGEFSRIDTHSAATRA
jgi:hypothetical protein